MSYDKWKLLLELPKEYQNADHNKCRTRHALNPIERQVMTERRADQNAHRGNCCQRQRRAEENFPRPFLVGRHGHRGELRLVSHLCQENDAEGCEQHAPVHVNSFQSRGGRSNIDRGKSCKAQSYLSITRATSRFHRRPWSKQPKNFAGLNASVCAANSARVGWVSSTKQSIG